MKKSLVVTLALVFVLGIAGTAFAAANPFVDVPAKHWAYDAVAKLANAGIVDGYNDGTFRGDKTMTRYEMAQIVAKAMVKSEKADAETKALVDKLAVEFNAELQNLGVRVAKLEKNASTVKFTGDVRLRYDNLADSDAVWKDRYRMNMNADINENTSLYARYVYNDDAFGKNSNRLSDLALTTKGLVDKTNVTVGRYTLNLGPTTYFSGTTGDIEGIQTTTQFSKNFSLMLGYADGSVPYTHAATTKINDNGTPADLTDDYPEAVAGYKDIDNIQYAEAAYTQGKTKVYFDYFKNIQNGEQETIFDVLGGGVAYSFDSNWKLIGEYYTNKADAVNYYGSDPKAIIGRVAYKAANAKNPGSFGLYADYLKFEGNVLPYKYTGGMVKINGADVGVGVDADDNTNGLKAYNLGFSYTLAKNVVLDGMYEFNIKDAYTGKDATNDKFTRVNLNFLF